MPSDPLRRVAAELYTVDDLAGLLQVSRPSLTAAARELPPAVKLGRLTRWPKRAIDRWLADNCPRQHRTNR
ncbi:MAG: helix-turn-helix domain-containing protein [Gemmataceae bacterium]